MLLAASGQVTGLPAVLIILAILVVLVLGIVALVRFVIRGGRRAAHAVTDHHTEPHERR